MVTKTDTIPSAKYAVFTAQGPFDTAIGATWQEIWNSDIQRAFTNDFELYDTSSFVKATADKINDENSIVKIYMTIK